MSDLTPRDPRPGRRDTDRLLVIERELAELKAGVAQLNATLGSDNATLMFNLDRRYLTHDAAAQNYVPRSEHEQQRRWITQTRLNLAGVIFVGAGWVTTIIELTNHLHR